MRRLVMTMAMVVLLAGACGDGEDPDGAGSAEAPADAVLLEGDHVDIPAMDNSFQPGAARVAAGTEVTFVNEGRNDHNVIPEDEDAEWRIDSDAFGPGDEGSYTFDEPGVYRFYCSIHGTIDAGMPGVLVVE